MQSRAVRRDYLLAFLCAALFLCLVFGRLLISPGGYFFGTYSDGLKNYYTPMYHASYDRSLIHFGGLNYPYGDHIFYADAQPLLVWPVQLLARLWPEAARLTPAIMNLCMLLSLPLASLVMFAILRRLNLPLAYSTAMSIGIVFLSPQVWRMGGHYSLSYTLAVPLIWLLFIRFTESPSIGRSILIPVTITAWASVHVYYLAICTLVVGALWVARWWRSRDKGLSISSLVFHVLLQTLLAPAALLSFLRLSDSVLRERPVPQSWGLNTASLKGILLPAYQPYFGNRFVGHLSGPELEGLAYVTLLGWVALLVLLVRVVRNLNWTSARSLRWFGPGLLREAGPASLLFFSVGLGIPSLLAGLVPASLAIQQFRTVGRFVWPGYYFYMTLAAYLVYLAFRRFRGRTRLAVPIIVLLTGIFGLEVINFSLFMSRRLRNQVEDLAPNGSRPLAQLLASSDLQRYQAILPIPFYHAGSETYFEYLGSETSIHNSMIASPRSGLPIVGCFLNRTSLIQTRKMLGFMEGNRLREEFINELPNRKPLLVIVSGSPVTEGENRLVRMAEYLGGRDGLRFYSLSIERLALAPKPAK